MDLLILTPRQLQLLLCEGTNIHRVFLVPFHFESAGLDIGRHRAVCEAHRDGLCWKGALVWVQNGSREWRKVGSFPGDVRCWLEGGARLRSVFFLRVGRLRCVLQGAVLCRWRLGGGLGPHLVIIVNNSRVLRALLGLDRWTCTLVFEVDIHSLLVFAEEVQRKAPPQRLGRCIPSQLRATQAPGNGSRRDTTNCWPSREVNALHWWPSRCWRAGRVRLFDAAAGRGGGMRLGGRGREVTRLKTRGGPAHGGRPLFVPAWK